MIPQLSNFQPLRKDLRDGMTGEPDREVHVRVVLNTELDPADITLVALQSRDVSNNGKPVRIGCCYPKLFAVTATNGLQRSE